jgi:uncharacterized membrane protein YeaQ/YmgE (transglycosylase-associated protein family)
MDYAGDDPGCIIVTILIGLAGAFAGGYAGTLPGLGTITGFDLRSFFIAILGALILLAGYRMIKQKAWP